jgi:hypothetical protein
MERRHCGLAECTNGAMGAGKADFVFGEVLGGRSTRGPVGM